MLSEVKNVRSLWKSRKMFVFSLWCKLSLISTWSIIELRVFRMKTYAQWLILLFQSSTDPSTRSLSSHSGHCRLISWFMLFLVLNFFIYAAIKILNPTRFILWASCVNKNHIRRTQRVYFRFTTRTCFFSHKTKNSKLRKI